MHRPTVLAWIFATLFLGTETGSIPFNDCGSLYHLQDVEVENCSSLPCVFPVDSIQKVKFVLYAEFDSAELRQQALFSYNGIRYGMVVTPLTPCGNNLDCPVKTGVDASFTANITINETLPLTSMTGQLNWTGTNENGDMILCMQTTVTLTEEYI